MNDTPEILLEYGKIDLESVKKLAKRHFKQQVSTSYLCSPETRERFTFSLSLSPPRINILIACAASRLLARSTLILYSERFASITRGDPFTAIPERSLVQLPAPCRSLSTTTTTRTTTTCTPRVLGTICIPSQQPPPLREGYEQITISPRHCHRATVLLPFAN